MKKKFVLVMGLVLMLTGCGKDMGYTSTSDMAANSSGYGYGSAAGMAEEIAWEEAADIEMPVEPTSDAVSAQRKLICTVDIDVEVKEPAYDLFLADVESEVQRLGGYAENMNTYNGNLYRGYLKRSTDYTLRIPKDNLDEFLDMVSGAANVVRRSDNVEDVTLNYVDMESRKNALKVEQDRLLEILEKAETVEDIITVEGRLSEVRYQLESMESQLRTIDNQVDYSTVYLSVSEVEELTPVSDRSILERIKDGFASNVHGICEGAKELFVFFIVSIPVILLGVVVIAVAVFLIKKFIKKHRVKKKTADDKKMGEIDH